jgi:murein DD-endopeptidase MepM/ murein hydrolase activator NlpD
MAVYAPYDSVVHSAKDNALFGDYGPTIILSHTIADETFYTLYGHLSRESLIGKKPGTTIKQGEEFARLGAPPINGDWPPHLHLQIILDMLGKVGDYPGVAAESQRDLFLTLCPDPNLIVRSSLL